MRIFIKRENIFEKNEHIKRPPSGNIGDKVSKV